MTALATLDDLAVYLGRELDDLTENRQAEQALDLVSAAVRAWCRRDFTQTTSTRRLPGVWGPTLDLPDGPVTAVTAVVLDDTTITDWTWNDRSQLIRHGYLTATDPDRGGAAGGHRGSWGGPQATVTVTYTHGYDPIPDDVRAAVLTATARSITNPVGVRSEGLGAYQVTYAGQAADLGAVVITDAERRLLSRYRRKVLA